jgi:5-methyltetrahydrofolate--homocysteine methyltransferase
VRTDIPIPAGAVSGSQGSRSAAAAELWSYINPYMLYGRHLGYKGNFEKALAEHEEKALELYHNMEEVKQAAAGFMKVKAVWQFFEAERDGNAIHLFAPAGASPCTLSASAGSAARTAFA